MTCWACAIRSSAERRYAAISALSVVLLGSSPAAAEAQPNAARAELAPGSPAEHAASALPAVPKLELSLPPVQSGAGYSPQALRAESPLWPAYWDALQSLRAWHAAGDGELRLKIETASFQWGALTLSAGIISIPERERECAPSCSGPEWTSSVSVRHPLGDAGPLREVGPEIEVGARPGAARGGSPGVVKAGVGGAF